MRHTAKIVALCAGAALGAVLMTAAPALAATNCYDTGGGGLRLGLGFHFGAPYTEGEIAQFAVMELRRRGVDAIDAEIWGGCIRAYVRTPGGGTHMEFFNAQTLEPVDAVPNGPLRLDLDG